MNQQEMQELLGKMTLEEKIGQLTQVSGFLLVGEEGELTGPMAQMGMPMELRRTAGSVLGSSGAEEVQEIIEANARNNRLGIPLVFMADIIHGYKTIFPIPLAIGASWNLELAKESARIAAKEASLGGVQVTFSPMVDLVRDPRWGRVMESTGEDSYLNSQYAKAFVEGYQGDDLKNDPLSLAACVKHFVGYGAAQAGRDYNTVDMSERVLREDYLPAFQAAVDAGVKLVMTSFNTMDGLPSTGNKWVMRDLLREDMGFEGVVISDWGAVKELIAHGVAADETAAGKMALEAGTDIEMMTFCYQKGLQSLVEAGEVDETVIDEAVLRVLQLKEDLNLFDNPYRGLDVAKEREYVLSEEPREAARKLAEESLVLLKNDNQTLPLNHGQTIALVGPYAEDMNLLGGWSWRGRVEDAVQLKEALEKEVELLTAEGVHISEWGESSRTNYEEALIKASVADVIVAAIGEHARMSGEGKSRADIKLPMEQLELLKDLKELGKPLVVVLFNGRPIDLHGILDEADAVLEAWFPGTEAGYAIANVLFGRVNPSGKTTMSFPYQVGQIPVYYNHYNTGRPAKGHEREAYVSNYLDIPNEPLIPFGYGLSYTTFAYKNLEVTTENNLIKVSVKVENTGEFTGKEVVQLYGRDLVGQVVRPVRELKGFEKIQLAPGEERTVTFELTAADLAYVGRNGQVLIEAGEWEFHVGGNSVDTIHQKVWYEYEKEGQT